MLPKIAVTVAPDRNEVLNKIGISENQIMTFEGKEAKVSELRSWIYSGMNIARSRPELSLVIWNADELSGECQAVLLKPMEEIDEQVSFYLIVENENRLSQTILSRGVIENHWSENPIVEKHWSDVRKCWSSGPSACIAFVDQLSKVEDIALLEEIILKLRLGLSTEVNSKRLKILDLAIESLAELKQTNINHKLSLDNFLISSWKMIKA